MGAEGGADDRELMERLARGDREALTPLVDRHQRRLYRIAVGYLRERLVALAAKGEARGEQAHAAAQPQVGEDHGFASVRVSRMRWSARCRLLFTVPRLMPSVVAISSRLSSW